MIDEALELLAPDMCKAGGAVAGRLRSAITLARLLATEGRAPRAESIGLDISRAEGELNLCIRVDALALLSELFFAHMVKRSGLEPWEVGARSTTELWHGVVRLEERKLGLALPSLPGPGECRSAVSQRILAAAMCLGLSSVSSALWRGHIAFSEQESRRAELSYRSVLGGAERGSFNECKTAISGVAGCLLDRGAVFLARDWMERHLDLVAASPELVRLAGLANLAAGDLEAAGEFLAPQLRRCLPLVFATLGDRRPDLRGSLSGPMKWEKPAKIPGAQKPRRLNRSDVGASGLFVLEAPSRGHSGRLLFSDLASSLGAPSAAWRDRQAAAPFTLGEPEQDLVATANLWVGFTDDEGGARLLRSCHSPLTKAVALVPIGRDAPRGGDLLGWIRLEFDHLLVPDAKRLAALGEAARRVFLGLPNPVEEVLEVERLTPLFEKLTKGISLGRRRWWGFVKGSNGPEFIASSGEAFGDWERVSGGCGALERAEKKGDRIGESLSYAKGAGGTEGVHPDAAAGLVLPIRSGGTCGGVCGWLVVESARRDDLGAKESGSLLRACRNVGAEIGLARFDLWHQKTYKHAVFFAAKNLAPLPAPLLALLGDEERELASCGPETVPLLSLVSQAATASLGVIVLVGGPGAGKRIAARLIHFERQGGEAAPKVLSLRTTGISEWLGALTTAAPGGVILEDLEDLDPVGQEALFELVERGEASLRHVVITTRTPLREGSLWPRLRDLLQHHQVILPPLTERRGVLPAFFDLFLSRAARRERRIAPFVTPRATGLIWRGDWEGGLRQLADFAHRVIIFGESDLLDEDELRRLAKQSSLELPKRFSSKHPDPMALWCALDTNRKKSGGFHRTRTAELMGWDPDTLTQRLRELGVD